MSFREWLVESCPLSMRTPFGSEADWVWGGRSPTFPSDDARLWLERMAARGFTAPTWPKKYGGGGLSDEEAALLAEEMVRLGCRDPLKSFGLWMLGPVLLEFGSEAQRERHLPPIVRGEIRWCQGYSEPAAGSDLASLQTRAVLDGDHYVVSGQKIWTSHADRSDWMFCLVRTAPPRHEGISFLLIDMQSAGIRARPIRLISGAFAAVIHHGLTMPANASPGIHGGWITPVHLYHSDMAMNYYGAIWAFSVNFIVAVLVSQLQKARPEPELVGLVYSLTPKPVEHHMEWYEKPSTIAIGLTIMFIALNVIFR